MSTQTNDSSSSSSSDSEGDDEMPMQAQSVDGANIIGNAEDQQQVHSTLGLGMANLKLNKS